MNPFLPFSSIKSHLSLTWNINISFLTASIQVLLGRLLVIIAILTVTLSLSLIRAIICLCCTYSNHFSRFSLILSSIRETSRFLHMHSFLILSHGIFPLSHFSILIYATVIFQTSCLLISQHSEIWITKI